MWLSVRSSKATWTGSGPVEYPCRPPTTNLDAESGEAVAFVIPNESNSAEVLSFALTVDAVEDRTGLDFFADLSAAEQAEFEGKVCVPCWFE